MKIQMRNNYYIGGKIVLLGDQKGRQQRRAVFQG